MASSVNPLVFVLAVHHVAGLVIPEKTKGVIDKESLLAGIPCPRQHYKALSRDIASEGVGTYDATYDHVDFSASYIVDPTPTLLSDLVDAKVPEGPSVQWHANLRDLDPRITRRGIDMVPFQMTDFNVSIMVYSKPFQTDGVHSGTIVKCGAWDGPTVMALCDAYKKYGATGGILDVGGNIGAYALPLAQCLKDAGSDGLVVSVEADARNNRHLRAAIKYNGLDNLHLYEYAVGDGLDRDSVVMDLGPPVNHGMPKVVDDSSLQSGGANRKKVPLTTIDAILAQEAFLGYGTASSPPGIFAMKMDIEGYEPQGLRGAAKLLASQAPCIVNIEVKSTGEEIRPLLEAAGYIEVKPHPDLHNHNDAWFERKDMEACAAALKASKRLPALSKHLSGALTA